MGRITQWLDRVPGQPAPGLDPEQLATIDIDSEVNRSRAGHLESMQEAAAQRALGERLTKEAESIEAANGGPVKLGMVMLGTFAIVTWLVSYALDVTLFLSLGLPLVLAVLVSLGTVAFFAVSSKILLVHNSAVPHLGGETNGARLKHGLLLALVVAGALYLAGMLGPARAEESNGPAIRTAQSTVDNGAATSLDPISLAAAKADLAAANDLEERTALVVTAFLGGLYLLEVAVSGYSTQVVVAAAVGRRRRGATSAIEAAEEEDDEARSGDLALAGRLAGVARRYGLPMENIDRLTRARVAAIREQGLPSERPAPTEPHSPASDPDAAARAEPAATAAPSTRADALVAEPGAVVNPGMREWDGGLFANP